jgi:hypothetical protein
MFLAAYAAGKGTQAELALVFGVSVGGQRSSADNSAGAANQNASSSYHAAEPAKPQTNLTITPAPQSAAFLQSSNAADVQMRSLHPRHPHPSKPLRGHIVATS